MVVNLSLPRSWPLLLEGPPRVAEVLPGVRLELDELVPLPRDLQAWLYQIVSAGVPLPSLRVGEARDVTTETGWPLTLFATEVIDPRTKAVLERRLHAIYRFDKFGGTATLRSANTQLFDAAVDEAIAVFLTGRPDWTTDAILCVSELWTGLELEPTSAPTETEPPTPESVSVID